VMLKFRCCVAQNGVLRGKTTLQDQRIKELACIEAKLFP
jgi:hypothetical protein